MNDGGVVGAEVPIVLVHDGMEYEPWGGIGKDGVLIHLAHEEWCRDHGQFPRKPRWEHLIDIRLFGVAFELWAPSCCGYEAHRGRETADTIEKWCGLVLWRDDEVDKVLRIAGVRRFHPDAWQACYRSLCWVFENWHHRWYIAADVMRLQPVRRHLCCGICKQPFAAWAAADRVSFVRYDDDRNRWEHTPHDDPDSVLCSAACLDRLRARWKALDELNRKRAEERAAVDARRLLAEAKRLATNPAARREAKRARQREEQARRSVVPQSEEV